MTCPFAHDDATYVLGALSPAERLEFERHLSTCEACTRAVRELAGIPGLLGRVDADVLAAASSSEDAATVPDTVLPGLVRSARRARRRRTLTAAVAAAAAAAVVAPVVVSQLDRGDEPPSSAVAIEPMDPVGEVPVPVVAELALENVLWGTRLELTCTYDTASVPYELPPAVDYVLVVRTEDGHTERVGSWRSVDGRTMKLTAGTAAPRTAIAWVEVRTADGRVVLHSRA